MDRYQRQILLPQIGVSGQARLAGARVLLIGCGALGSVLADQLARAGVGAMCLVDRDVVEWTNLQRQVLYDEADARAGTPKALAAGRRVSQINSSIQIQPIVADAHAGTIESLAGVEAGGQRVDLILDGTDNVETRYLINDVAVKHHLPWVYGACVGTEGRVMTIWPGVTACLRCIFPHPPRAGELPTCDTTGVLGAAASVVASLQAVAAIKVLAGRPEDIPRELLRLDVWKQRFHQTALTDARRLDCPTCGRRNFEFLDRMDGGRTASLCGRNAVQIRPAQPTTIDLKSLADRLAGCVALEQTAHLIRCRPEQGSDIQLTVFPDGRAIVHGTNDPQRARAVYARWVGM